MMTPSTKSYDMTSMQFRVQDLACVRKRSLKATTSVGLPERGPRAELCNFRLQTA
jgi:hypothetical protein